MHDGCLGSDIVLLRSWMQQMFVTLVRCFLDDRRSVLCFFSEAARDGEVRPPVWQSRAGFLASLGPEQVVGQGLG